MGAVHLANGTCTCAVTKLPEALLNLCVLCLYLTSVIVSVYFHIKDSSKYRMIDRVVISYPQEMIFTICHKAVRERSATQPCDSASSDRASNAHTHRHSSQNWWRRPARRWATAGSGLGVSHQRTFIFVVDAVRVERFHAAERGHARESGEPKDPTMAFKTTRTPYGSSRGGV